MKRKQIKNDRGPDAGFPGVAGWVYTGILIQLYFREMALNHRLVEQCVEHLCQKGCRAVWSDIDALEAGQPLAEVDGLSKVEREAVIVELKAVMAVYNGSCSAS